MESTADNLTENSALSELLDGIAEMIDNGRLTQESIPDDFFWLKAKLADARRSLASGVSRVA